jgi:flagellar biosynthesis/type III secretory pathway protein FliH
MSDLPWQVGFRAAEQPTIAWTPHRRLDPTQVEAVVFPDATQEARLMEGLAPAEPEPERDEGPDVAALTAEAERRGYERGRAEAETQHRRELDALRSQVKASLSAFRRGLDQAEVRADQEAIDLAVMLAEHLVRREMTGDFDAVASALAGAVPALEGMEPLTLVASAETAATLSTNLGELQQRLGVAGVQIEVSQHFGPADFILQRGDAAIDLRIEQRLTQLKKLLVSAAEGSEA